MDRREILNELQQIVAITDTIGPDYRIPEVAQRAKALIREVESWPPWWLPFHPIQPESKATARRCQECGYICGEPVDLLDEADAYARKNRPAPFISDQCAARHHADCPLGFSHSRLDSRVCKCACHCPPEAPQQPAEPAPLHECHCACHAAPDAPQQPAEPTPLAERHIDTPDELLELLAGVSSDPQIEGLSLSQKASTMALLYAAKALQQIAQDVKAIADDSRTCVARCNARLR